MKEILIKNVTILTMDDENSRFFGWILLKNGKIDALGEGEPPACSEVLDGEGGVLTPGLIDIHSHLGLYEDGLARTATRTPILSRRRCALSTRSTRWTTPSARRSRPA